MKTKAIAKGKCSGSPARQRNSVVKSEQGNPEGMWKSWLTRHFLEGTEHFLTILEGLESIINYPQLECM